MHVKVYILGLLFLGCTLQAASDDILAKQLFDAIEIGSVEEVKDLLTKNPDLIDAQNNDEETPLYQAIFWGKDVVVRVLLDRGANIDTQDNDGKTPLHLAACRGTSEVVRVLLDRGANVDAQDKCGDTPLHRAVFWSNSEVVKLLLTYNADPTIKNNYGKQQSAIDLANGNSKASIVEILEEWNVGPNIKGSE